jgi:NADPH-dependent 2,4-dienoyl-CoA reductase/sulfur reductase-like enzyme
MSAQTNRLNTGGRIDRSRVVNFSFEGKSYSGFAGDTLASALLANGVRLVGRSFIPAGFYYKTFMWPAKAWLFYEKFIRQAAGLGKGPTEVDPDRYDKLYHTCDVLVIGAGPAGLAAALAAGRTGARVVLADELS